MPRDVELIQRQFGSNEPLPSIELADNALKLGGIEANLYALKSDLSDEAAALIGNIDEVLDELRDHENDDVRHLTQGQIDKIQAAINAAQALAIANGAVSDAVPSITAQAVQAALNSVEPYVDTAIANSSAQLRTYADGKAGTAETNAKNYTDDKFADMNFPTYIDPETQEPVQEDLGKTLSQSPNNLINPEYFYRFKNLMDNSSFEVYDGNTKRPYGWDNGVSSGDASMFEARSLKLTSGQTAKQTSQHQANAQWLKGAYDTNDAILAFYHKFDAVTVKIYDVINESYMTLTALDKDLSEIGSPATSIQFPEETNWNQYRCMVKFTPASNTQKMRVEFTCESGGTEGECYIDAPSLEPYEEGKYPSIYKHGRYSTSAYQVINPPPEDVDRFTPLEHLTLATSTEDTRGNVTYQEWERSDGTLAITRSCSNADINGFYETIVETFYKKDGVTVNYVDTYSLTYSATGAILTQSKTTTEVVG